MTCSEFLARFSDFYDGDPSVKDERVFLDHLDSCGACRRYREVVRTGVELLRTLPPTGPRDDFRERLRHSIYHVDEERRRERDSTGASGVMMMVATAAFLAAVVGAPLLWKSEPSVHLSPIVVHDPGGADARAITVVHPEPTTPSSFRDLELWAQSNALLYEHSRLYQRYREPGFVRTGLR